MYNRIPLNTMPESLKVMQGKTNADDYVSEEHYTQLKNFGRQRVLPAMAVSACSTPSKEDRQSILNSIAPEFKDDFTRWVNVYWQQYMWLRNKKAKEKMK